MLTSTASAETFSTKSTKQTQKNKSKQNHNKNTTWHFFHFSLWFSGSMNQNFPIHQKHPSKKGSGNTILEQIWKYNKPRTLERCCGCYCNSQLVFPWILSEYRQVVYFKDFLFVCFVWWWWWIFWIFFNFFFYLFIFKSGLSFISCTLLAINDNTVHWPAVYKKRATQWPKDTDCGNVSDKIIFLPLPEEKKGEGMDMTDTWVTRGVSCWDFNTVVHPEYCYVNYLLFFLMQERSQLNIAIRYLALTFNKSHI